MTHEEFGKFPVIGVLGGKQLKRRGLGPAFKSNCCGNLNNMKF
jgi:hypothetical protein